MESSCVQQPATETAVDQTQYVDPFIGSGFSWTYDSGATRPYAMVQVSPDTHILGWTQVAVIMPTTARFMDSAIRTCQVLALATMGDIALLPYSGEDSIKPVATFQKETEQATPGLLCRTFG